MSCIKTCKIAKNMPEKEGKEQAKWGLLHLLFLILFSLKVSSVSELLFLNKILFTTTVDKESNQKKLALTSIQTGKWPLLSAF